MNSDFMIIKVPKIALVLTISLFMFAGLFIFTQTRGDIKVLAQEPPPAGPQCAPRQCADGLDNDNDGKNNYPDDPGCENLQDNDETDGTVPQQPACSKNPDNCGGGLVCTNGTCLVPGAPPAGPAPISPGTCPDGTIPIGQTNSIPPNMICATPTLSVCTGGLSNCNGVCVDVSSDQNNCGACGRACQANQYCDISQPGGCIDRCPAGYNLCGEPPNQTCSNLPCTAPPPAAGAPTPPNWPCQGQGAWCTQNSQCCTNSCNGTCQATTCNKDQDCPIDKTCNSDGLCGEHGGPCKGSDDCRSDRICRAGFCERRL